ncbi:MAG: hypothetical protein CM1200mP41_37210 [Gammaproteobacteria bacterium]|nr:MAG: hypothetical protein CM1200mP41_37210 [Gammaproteobacteria bacterium]
MIMEFFNMARLPYLTRPDLPERDRDLLDRDFKPCIDSLPTVLPAHERFLI